MEILTTRLRRIAARLAITAAACALGGACATFVAPVEYTSQTDDSQGAAPDPSPLHIRPLEGRPGGLVLELTADFELESGSRLVVRRRVGSAAAEVLRTIELGPERAAHLSDEGLQFIDRGVTPESELAYRLDYYGPERSAVSESSPDRSSSELTLSWHSPPPRPEEVTARVDTARAVELRWSPADSGALVFRRDVLDESGDSRRIGSVDATEGGVLLDRDVRPGGVYAYRVALAVERESYPQYGPPSEPLYVSVPESVEHRSNVELPRMPSALLDAPSLTSLK